MNCKPGDLAITVGYHHAYPHLTGRLVDVVEAAPVGVDFKLPDGKSHSPCGPGEWVIRFQSPVNLHAARGRSNGFYACTHDRNLRPISDPGEDAVDELLQRIGSPNEVTA